MSIEPISDKVLWDRFVDASPDGTLFHKWDFLKIAEKYTGYRLFPYGIYKDEELISIIPLFYIRKKGLKFVYSPPQTTLSYIPYMSFVYGQAYYDLKQREREGFLCYVLDEADKALKCLSPNYTSFAVGPGYADTRPYIWHGYEPILQYTYMMDLDNSIDTMWKDMSHKFRKSISDVLKLSPSIERVYDADAFFSIMRERLTNVYEKDTFFHRQSPDYLKELLSAFPDNIKMHFMYSDNDLIGSIVNYEYKDCCIEWMGNAVAYNGVSANDYFIWELIKRAKESGYKKFDILGADEKRLNGFKNKFNPSPAPYFYMIKKDMIFKTASYGSELIDKVIRKKDHRASDDRMPGSEKMKA